MSTSRDGQTGSLGLNIKNERVHELARQAASVTGLTHTDVVPAVR
ncbi:type II toxin-antitoxin system VapB family antitoxin [Janibacter anophelis]|nr:type II toxin-antitoxin system VapB family antitoxin [Janibacter anophelis]